MKRRLESCSLHLLVFIFIIDYTFTCTLQIAALESELESVGDRARQFEEELAEESEGVDVQLMASQVAEYNQLKAKAGKKTTTLTEQLRLVSLAHLEA